MKKIIKWTLITILGLALLGTIGFLGVVYSVTSWYRENNSKPRRTTYAVTGGKYKHSQESVKRGVFVKKLNYVMEIDSLKKYFNEKDTIFYIEKGYHWGKMSTEDTRILTEKETNYPYQFIACDIRFDNKKIRFHYFKEDNLKVQDSLGGIYYHQKIMLKKVQNDTFYLKVFLNRTPQHPNAEKEVGTVKVFGD